MPTSDGRPVVVITGASGGIGRACVRAFADRGYAVGLLARGLDGLAGAATDVADRGSLSVTVPVDVADAEDVEMAADTVARELGRIDVWVNVAFASVFAPFMQIGAAEFERITAVSYLGYVNGTRAALRHMLPENRGAIVQVGSALAYRGIPLQTGYCGAKHAIQGFNEALRCELLHDRSSVKVTMVQMPAVNTPQFDWVLSRLPRHPQPVAPIYQPEVAARAVVYAAEHPGRREYWVGASTVGTLIANAVAPGILDRYLGRTGFTSQQESDESSRLLAPNLWEATDRRSGTDQGAHGSFDDRSTSRSPQVWASQHHGLLGLAAAVAGIGVAASIRSWRR